MTDTNTKPPLPASGRRHPWVTYLLLAGLLAGHVALRADGGDASAPGARSQALAFYAQVPFVELAPRFERWLGSARVEADRAASLALREKKDLGAPTQRYLERAQYEFAPLQEAALTELEALPQLRLRVEGRGTPGANYVAHAFVEPDIRALAVALVFLALAGMALEGAWGSLAFASLCVPAVAGSAALFAVRYGSSGGGWSGASALVAALLGAYLIRGLSGFRVPGWVLLPAWVGLEYFVVRGAAWDTLSAEPWLVHAAAAGYGATVAVVMSGLGTEKAQRRKRFEEREVVSKSALDRAMSAREDGRPGDAYEILAQEFDQSPGDLDVAVALWDSACELSQPQLAVAAILAVIRDAVRRGGVGDIVRHWMDLESQVRGFEAEPALCVHAAEALLEDGRPHEAVRAVELALAGAGELPAAMARRAALAVRGLEPDLAARAAERALADPQLPAQQREELQEMVAAAVAGAAADSGEASPAAPSPATPASAPAGKEATPMAQTGAPGSVSESSSALPSGGLPDPTHAPAAPAGGEPLHDVGAVSLEAVSEEVAGGAAAAGYVFDPEQEGIALDSLLHEPAAETPEPGGAGWQLDPEASGLSTDDISAEVASPGGPAWDPHAESLPLDALRQVRVGEGGDLDEDAVESWNDPHVVGDGTRALDATAPVGRGGEDALDALADGISESELDALAEEISDSELEALADDIGESELAALAAETVDSENARAPSGSGAGAGDAASSSDEGRFAALANEELGRLLDEPASAEPAAEPAAASAAPHAAARRAEPPSAVVPEPAATTGSPESESAARGATPSGDGVASAVERAAARPARRLEGCPLELRPDGFVFFVEQKGKNRLPYEQIEAISAAAVPGESGKALLVIDVVLNWLEVGDEPLRLIRFTSRGFDPRSMFPDAGNATEALQHFLVALLDRSGAHPLPDPAACVGRPFAHYPSLADYEQKVLNIRTQ